MIPDRVFLTRGVGQHRDKLQSFELALRNAGIEVCNLVEVSSIVPPNCTIISVDEGKQHIRPGEITFCVMSQNATDEANRQVAASVGMALPRNRDLYGYLSEYHSYGEPAKQAGDYAEDLAATMLATTLGLDFDPGKAWDERKQEYQLSGHIVRSRNVTQSARGAAGKWTTVLAAAIFLFDG